MILLNFKEKQSSEEATTRKEEDWVGEKVGEALKTNLQPTGLRRKPGHPKI